jgi:hypothetical protein
LLALLRLALLPVLLLHLRLLPASILEVLPLLLPVRLLRLRGPQS